MVSSRHYNGADMSENVRITLRLPPGLHAAIKSKADGRMRSLNNMIVTLLKIGLVSDMDEDQALAAADELIAKVKTVPKRRKKARARAR